MRDRSRALSVGCFCLLILLLSDVSHALITKKEGVDIPTKVVIVQQGDTLRRLAARHLGDANRWREFLKVNDFSNPDALTPGEQIYVPIKQAITTSAPPRATPRERKQIAEVKLSQATPAKIRWITDDTSLPASIPRVLIIRIEDVEGNPVPNARVEWVLNRSPQMVGDILEADDDDERPTIGLPSQRPLWGKQTNRFAITSTNREPTTLEMGDSSSTTVGIGETWITLQASQPGITDVTVFCPAIPRNARYHSLRSFRWIDLAWDPVSAGQSLVNPEEDATNVAVIPVRLRRPSDNQPASGIGIRYTLLPGGPKATLDGNAAEMRAVTDANGVAQAHLNLLDPFGGTHRIRIEILDEQAQPLAGYLYTHSWVGPTLQIRQEGPGTVGLQNQIEYTLHVENTGTDRVSGLTLVDTIPTQGLALVDASDGGRITDGKITWDIGALEPGESVARSLRLRGIEPGIWQMMALVTGSEGIRIRSAAGIRVEIPELELQISGPATAQISQRIEYFVRVSNPNDFQVTNVLVNFVLPDNGLRLVQSTEKTAQEDRNLLWYVDVLPSGGTREMRLQFRGESLGRWTTEAHVSCNEGAEAHAQVVTRIVTPALTLQLASQPVIAHLDQEVQITLTVENTGDMPATGVLLANKLPTSFIFLNASERGQLTSDGLVTWDLQTIQPNTEAEVSLVARPTAAGKHINRATVTSGEGLTVKDELILTIVAQPVIKITTTDSEDPVRTGKEITYATVIQNVGKGDATGVSLSIVLPEGLRVIETTSTTGRHSVQGNRLDFDIGTLPAETQVTIIVRLLALQPGDIVHSAVLTYNEFSRPMRVEESTVVTE